MTAGRVLKIRFGKRGSLNVRFAPKATELLRRRGMLFIQAARVILVRPANCQSTALEPGSFAPLNAGILMFWPQPLPTS